jgi:hypothetical protein
VRVVGSGAGVAAGVGELRDGQLGVARSSGVRGTFTGLMERDGRFPGATEELGGTEELERAGADRTLERIVRWSGSCGGVGARLGGVARRSDCAARCSAQRNGCGAEWSPQPTGREPIAQKTAGPEPGHSKSAEWKPSQRWPSQLSRDQASARQLSADQPGTNQPSRNRASTRQPSARQFSAGQPGTTQRSGSRASARQFSAGQPGTSQPSGNRASARQSNAGQPSGRFLLGLRELVGQDVGESEGARGLVAFA